MSKDGEIQWIVGENQQYDMESLKKSTPLKVRIQTYSTDAIENTTSKENLNNLKSTRNLSFLPSVKSKRMETYNDHTGKVMEFITTPHKLKK